MAFIEQYHITVFYVTFSPNVINGKVHRRTTGAFTALTHQTYHGTYSFSIYMSSSSLYLVTAPNQRTTLLLWLIHLSLQLNTKFSCTNLSVKLSDKSKSLFPVLNRPNSCAQLLLKTFFFLRKKYHIYYFLTSKKWQKAPCCMTRYFHGEYFQHWCFTPQITLSWKDKGLIWLPT